MKTEIFENYGGGLSVRVYHSSGGWSTYPISHTYDNQYWRKLGPDEVLKCGDRYTYDFPGARYEVVLGLAGLKPSQCTSGTICYRSCGKVPRRKKKRKRRDPHTVEVTFRCTPEFAEFLSVYQTSHYTPDVYADSMTRLGNAAAQALEKRKKATEVEKKMNRLRQLQRDRDKVLAELEELQS